MNKLTHSSGMIGMISGIVALAGLDGCTPETAQDIVKLMNEGPVIADSLYSEQNWNRTITRASRTMRVPNFLVVNPDGTTSLADVEVAFVPRSTDVTYWCRNIFDRQRIADKCGCTIGRSPYRIVAIDPESAKQMNGVCGLPGQTLHHELWHLKGFYEHVQSPDGSTWPAINNNSRPAPKRPMQQDEFSRDLR